MTANEQNEYLNRLIDVINEEHGTCFSIQQDVNNYYVLRAGIDSIWCCTDSANMMAVILGVMRFALGAREDLS